MDNATSNEDARSALLVIRLWTPEGATFRARLTGSSGTTQAVTPIAVAGSKDDLLDAVGRWIDEAMAADQDATR
jgi:hypothetical protein